MHSANGEHPIGLALDIAPDKSKGGTWADIDALAAWAEPRQNHPVAPFRWVGYDGDAGHGRGHHLHLSWQHSDAKPGVPADSVYTLRCPRRGPKRGGGGNGHSQPDKPDKPDKPDSPSGGTEPGDASPSGPSGGTAPKLAPIAVERDGVDADESRRRPSITGAWPRRRNGSGSRCSASRSRSARSPSRRPR